MDYEQMGRDAFHNGAVRVAPIDLLLAANNGRAGHPLDAWYTGYDKARGIGPYLNGRPEGVTGKH